MSAINGKVRPPAINWIHSDQRQPLASVANPAIIGDKTGPKNGDRTKYVIATETWSTSKISRMVPDPTDKAGDAKTPDKNLRGRIILMWPLDNPTPMVKSIDTGRENK